MKKTIILSGGLDSTTLLYDVVERYGSKNVLAISFNYGSKHSSKELAAAKKSCEKLKVEHKLISLNSISEHFKSDLLKSGGDIPEGHYANKNMKSTVVPFRNGILLSVAVGITESVEGDEVFYGAHAGDHDIYPDCREGFIKAMSQAATEGTYKHVSITAPYWDIDKGGVIEIGTKLGVDYSNTWTCYKGGEKPCGRCGSCVERTEAFINNGLKDPLYSPEEWKKAVSYIKKITK